MYIDSLDQFNHDRNTMGSNPETRSAHPFFMFDHMHEQPSAIAETWQRNRAGLLEFTRLLTRRSEIVLTGTGTSLHAAMLGEYWLRTIAGLRNVRAISAFDLANYAGTFPSDGALIVVSHRGWKQFSAKAVATARNSGLLTASISGQGPAEGARTADHVFITTEQETSGAHTKSLTTALGLLLELACELAVYAGRAPRAAAARAEFQRIPDRLMQRLRVDAQERAAAERFREFRRIVFIGGGPAFVCAREAALKVKEAAFAWAEGIDVEEFLHGPIAAADRETLAVLISAGGAAAPRVHQTAAALAEVGAARLAVALRADDKLGALCDAHIAVEGDDELTAPFALLLSLQLFTYYSALARGTNPDLNHREDPRFVRAAKHYQL
ncbi:MAG: SIS domain-containing protein [Candidatus Binataceae bacterium]